MTPRTVTFPVHLSQWSPFFQMGAGCGRQTTGHFDDRSLCILRPVPEEPLKRPCPHSDPIHLEVTNHDAQLGRGLMERRQTVCTEMVPNYFSLYPSIGGSYIPYLESDLVNDLGENCTV